MRFIRKDLQYYDNSWREIAFVSDIHYGSSHCRESELKSFLDERKENNAILILGGDILDNIYYSDQSRYQPNVLNKRYLGVDDPLGCVIDDFFDFIKPYANLIHVISLGNHETSVIKYSNIDPISVIVKMLNGYLRENGSNHVIEHGGWSGAVQYRLSRLPNGEKSQTLPLNIFYTHGSGGASPVTEGVIDFKRWMVGYEGFHFYMCGHKHAKNAVVARKFSMPTLREKPKFKSYELRLLRSAAWADPLTLSTHNSNVSWEERCEFKPMPIGSSVGRFKVVRKGKQRTLHIITECTI